MAQGLVERLLLIAMFILVMMVLQENLVICLLIQERDSVLVERLVAMKLTLLQDNWLEMRQK